MTHNNIDAIEQWRSLVGWEGWYVISTLGRLKRVKSGTATQAGRILAECKTPNGYVRNIICRGSEKSRRALSRHRAVAEAFLGAPSKGMFVNHINGNKSDNRLQNLEWVTPKQNSAHALSTGLQRRALSEAQVRDIRLMALTTRKKEVANLFEIDPSTVSRIVSRRNYASVE